MRKCYYDVLGVPANISGDGLKVAYRKLAMRMHPDKRRDVSADEANRDFQLITEAYQVLNDTHERAWYDSHRNQFLHGDDEVHDNSNGTVNIWPYFMRKCFGGFDDSDNGFYTVYGEAFATIHAQDCMWSAAENVPNRPPFGNQSSSWKEVCSFYNAWAVFSVTSKFSHALKWNLKDAPNRQVRRLMEAENKAAINEAIREYTENVRRLVDFVKRRDPRIQERNLKMGREAAQRAAEKKVQAEMQAAQQAAVREAARRAEVERREALRRERDVLAENGQAFYSDCDDSDETKSKIAAFLCKPCNKAFKTANQYKSHTESRKHKQTISQNQRQEGTKLEAESAPPRIEAQEECKPLRNPRVTPPPLGPEDSVESSDDTARLIHLEIDSDCSEASDYDEDAFATSFFSSPRLNISTSKKNNQKKIPTCVSGHIDVHDSEGSNQPESKKQVILGKAAQKRLKKQMNPFRCQICGEGFPSKTKMFNHIRDTGHAALKAT